MSGDRDQTGDTTASRADGGNAPPADGGAQGGAGQGHAGQGQGGYAQGGGGMDFERWGKLGTGIFGTFGVGTALTLFLMVSMMPSGGAGGNPLAGLGMGDGIAGSLMVGFFLVVFLGPLVATGLGAYVAGLAPAHESGPAAGAVAAGVGSAVTMVALVVLAILFSSSGGGGGGLGDLVAPLVGAVIGIAATAAGGAFAAENLPDL